MKRVNRILVGAGIFLLLGAMAWVVTREEPVQEFKSPLPDIDTTQVDRLEIVRPGEDGDRTVLAKQGETWRLVEPRSAPAEARAVENALTALGELSLLDEASRSSASHESLEVDDAHGIRVKVGKGGRTLADFLIGAFKGNFTMVRIPGRDPVYRSAGSMKHVFNKPTKDWRDKVIFDVQPEDVVELEFQSPNGHFLFKRGEGDWIPSGDAIEGFDFHKVSSLVTSLSRLRATDFEDDKRPEEVGLGPDAPWLRFRARDGTEDLRLRVGMSVAERNTERFYVQREGSPQVYFISKYLADRFRPGPERFKASPNRVAKRPPADAGPRRDAGQVPPEIMRQVERELAKQKQMKQLMGQ